ncbi:transketolase [Pelolinea submarina]|uniref:Transketolase n=1 Tax=Pelolinea submarina TaxID=913107 RepID=A0A347ZPN6_9CHLR|nr:transketolase [Pelolinea submarina]REG04718.1 transketolase [Pelolinea submarina]BBB47267.1 transketolase [Pelolinea submarina]
MSENTKLEEQTLYLQNMARTIREDLLTMIFAAQSGHPGGSLSAADIVTALYFHFLRIDPQDPRSPDRDRFILSKGHTCPVWYSCLAEKGFFPVEELLTLRAIDSRLQGHPDMNKTPGVDFTTGSLGQGLSIGVGMAISLHTDCRNARVYVVLGDGELNEGQVWEAAMAGAKFKLGNLTAIVDYNDLQLDGFCHDIMPIEPLKDKWLSFGWNVIEIDGHNMPEILEALTRVGEVLDQPTVIIAHTIKGKGVSFMENVCEWHGIAPNREQYVRAIQEISGDEGLDRLKKKFKPLASMIEPPAETAKSKPSDRKPTRDAYGECLAELGREFEDIVVLEADISKSTRTKIFADEFPERFFQFGVAEADMMGAAAGFASTGKIPFVSTYSVFSSMRTCEQIRTSIAYTRINVKIAVSHGGITPANDGVTHQSTEDMGIMRTIPNMTVIMPADYFSTKKLLRAALAMNGPVYLRFTRDAVPFIYSADEEFEIGRGKILEEGGDLTLVANGDMLSVALQASALLRRQGIRAEVIDIHTIKPLDTNLILGSAAKTGRVITVEDHQINGALGSAVAELLGEELPCRMARIGLRDTFAESGPYELLLKKYKMDAESIVAQAFQLLEK